MTGTSSYPFFSDPPPRIAGHRGAAGTTPENTLVSFRRGLEDGATFIELDVHASRDGEIVIIHDETVQRTTDGDGAVREMDLAELGRLDAGFRFTPDGGATHPFRGRGIGVPTLREFFSEFPGTRATLEIKELPAPAIETLFDLVEEFGKAEEVLVAAEDDATMEAARAVIRRRGLPVATGFSTGEIRAFLTPLWMGGEPPAGHRWPGAPDPAALSGDRPDHPGVGGCRPPPGRRGPCLDRQRGGRDEGTPGARGRRHHHGLPGPAAGPAPSVRSAVTCSWESVRESESSFDFASLRSGR